MGENKNIDRLFQEKFKNFEQAPSDHIWENIREELEKAPKSKKKRLPIWYRLGGVAAALILLIGLVDSLWSDESPVTDTTIVNTDSNNNEEFVNDNKSETPLKGKSNIKENVVIEEGKENKLFNPQKHKESIVTESSNNRDDDNIISNSKNDSYVNNNNVTQKENHLLKDKIEPNSNEHYLKETVVNNQSQQQQLNKVIKWEEKGKQVFHNTSKNSDKNSVEKSSVLNNNIKDFIVAEKELKQFSAPTNENDLVENEMNSTNKKNNKQINDIDKRELGSHSKNKIVKTTDEGVVSNNKNQSYKTNVNEIENISNKKSLENSLVTDTSIDKEKLEKTLNDNPPKDKAVAENSIENNKSESPEEEELPEEVQEEEKSLTIEEAIAEQENKEESKEEALQNKWQVRPNIAPVYYNSLSSGSPIDEQFKGNKKKGELNMSYGVNVSYNLNKKLKVRTGVNKVELGYNTENVAVVPAAEGASIDYIKNVTMSSAASQLNISSADGFSVSQIPSSFQNLFDASISQKFGYLEVPIELSYQVSSKKISIDLIAGMSTFFLNKNEVHAKTNSFTTYLGEANNLNKTSFSTNFGVGFNYKISKAFHLNVEPTFKYQLNSFSSDAGNFKPYILGVYSGLSFKF